MSAPWISLPQAPVIPGQSGHDNDHDLIQSALSKLWGAVAQYRINAMAPPYSAAGDGVTDDTAAINAALAAANSQGGGVVYLPWTTSGYLISAPLELPPMVTLAGETRVSLAEAPGTVPAVSRIIASAAWAPSSATGMVRVRSMTAGGWSTQNNWAGLHGIKLDGSQNASTNLNSLYFVGPVFDFHAEDVTLYKPGHNGVLAAGQAEAGYSQTFPWHHRWRNVTTYYAGARGFDLTNQTDGVYSECMAFGCISHGWVLTNVPNSKFTIKAEWNGGSGIDMTGSGTGIVLAGCETDQNTQRGIFINSVTDTTAGAISITGYKGHLNGKDGSSADIEITSTTVPVVITGAVIEADSSSGTTYPLPGIKVTSSTAVAIGTCSVGGQTGGIVNGGGNTILSIGDDNIEIVGALGSASMCPTQIFAVKPTDQTLTASTTLQNDSALLTPTLSPNSTWEVMALIAYDDSTTGDFKIGWAHPTGSTFVWSGAAAGTGASTAPVNLGGAINGVTSSGIYGGVGAGTQIPVLVQGILTVTTAGVLQLQWAQNASDPATLTVRAGSYLRLKRVA